MTVLLITTVLALKTASVKDPAVLISPVPTVFQVRRDMRLGTLEKEILKNVS